MATAEQTVSAVLEATNKRYVIEVWKSEDGKNGYTKYSDGWIEQYGVIENVSGVADGSFKTEPLSTEFATTDYIVNTTTNSWYWTFAQPKDTANFEYNILGSTGNVASNTGRPMYWTAEGY